MATRFWVPQPISAIANNGSGACRCTVSSTTGMTSADTRFFFGVTGSPLLIGNQTITVIDATHIDIAAISFVATGTGSCNGVWDANNTNNWVTTTGGTNYGQTVPGSADTVTFDGASGGGVVTVAATINGTNAIAGMTTSAFTGTLDFSVNNPSLTSSGGWTDAATGIHTVNLGSGTFTFTSTFGALINITAGTNLTLNAGTSTIMFVASSAAPAARTLNFGGHTLATISLSGTNSVGIPIVFTSSCTIGTLLITSGTGLTVNNSVTLTITNAVTWAGTSTSPIQILGAGVSTISVAAGSAISWASLAHIAFSNSSISATNSFDQGGNNMNGGSITSPSGGSSAGGVYGS